MAKDKSAVVASLKAIFQNVEGSSGKADKPAKVAPQKSSLAEFRTLARRPEPTPVQDEDEDTGEVEDEDTDESEDTDTQDEAETSEDCEVSPTEELLDRVESLIDYIVENGAALKSWIAAAR